MADLKRPIKNVVVLGATGNSGRPIIASLLAHPAGYTVTAVTRNDSAASLPPGVKVAKTDFSDDSLGNIFTGQDAVIACLPASQLAEQRRFIDIAISRNVVRFVPSEFGMDTAKPEALKWRPGLAGKVKILEYLKSNEDKLTWTAFMTGGFFDWAMSPPGGFGFDITKRHATIFDGGDVEWETSNLQRVGDAVANALSPRYQEVSANQIAYINSFTVSQNKILSILEKQLDTKFEVTQDTTLAYRDRAAERLKKDPKDFSAALAGITASILGLGGINRYSKEREIWNAKLGLEEESLEETLKTILKKY